MTSHLLEIQDRMTSTLHRVKQQSAIDYYMNDLKTCTGDCSEKFQCWLLSVEKVSKLMGNDPKDICFTKAEGNLLNSYIQYH